jgi:ferredoxin
MKQEILDLASRVRQAVIDYGESLCNVYRGMAFDPDNLGGACAIASTVLQKVLRQRGYDAEFVCSEGKHCHHCWVEVQGEVVDITATQFGQDYPEVHVVPPNCGDPIYRGYRDTEFFRGKKALERVNLEWDLHQTPRRHSHWIDEVVRCI